jgi:hypothetical protein
MNLNQWRLRQVGRWCPAAKRGTAHGPAQSCAHSTDILPCTPAGLPCKPVTLAFTTPAHSSVDLVPGTPSDSGPGLWPPPAAATAASNPLAVLLQGAAGDTMSLQDKMMLWQQGVGHRPSQGASRAVQLPSNDHTPEGAALGSDATASRVPPTVLPATCSQPQGGSVGLPALQPDVPCQKPTGAGGAGHGLDQQAGSTTACTAGLQPAPEPPADPKVCVERERVTGLHVSCRNSCLMSQLDVILYYALPVLPSCGFGLAHKRWAHSPCCVEYR